MEHREHGELILVRPPEGKTLHLVVGVDCLRIVYGYKGLLARLIWPADEVSSQTPGRLQQGDISLDYNTCHVRRSA
jgi:hypothetical protein